MGGPTATPSPGAGGADDASVAAAAVLPPPSPCVSSAFPPAICTLCMAPRRAGGAPRAGDPPLHGTPVWVQP